MGKEVERKKVEKGSRERENVIPDRASWDASKRVRNRYLLASISRGLISSITESRPTGLSELVCTVYEERDEKNTVAQCTICTRSCWNVSPFLYAMEIAGLSDRRILRRWRVTLVLIDHYATQSAQQAINNSLLFLQYTNIARCPVWQSLTKLPRLYS